jgi:hypothetical protein
MLINARDFHYQIDFRNLKKKEVWDFNLQFQ